MYLIVGLGNPGKKYARTRHNVGWLVLDELNKKLKIKNKKHILKIKNYLESQIYEVTYGDKKFVLAKPLTYMNNSGEAARLLINSTRRVKNSQPDGFSFLYLIHDDLDIPLGSFKIQFGKGPKEHKGVESVEEALGTKDFWRVRVGVENRKLKAQGSRLKARETGEEYVLGKFSPGEVKVLERVIPEVVERLMEKIKVN